MSPLGRYGPGKTNSLLRPAGTLLFDQPWSPGQAVLEDQAAADPSADGASAETGTRPVCWPCRRSRRCQERAGSSDTSGPLPGVGLGPAWDWQVGLGAERELGSHPPVLGHLLSVVAPVELPQLLEQSRSQHVIHPLLQPLVQS